MDCVEGFKEDLVARGITPHGIETYLSCIRSFLEAHREPAEVSLNDLRAYLVELRSRELSGSTLKGYFSALSSFYDYLVFSGAMESNPIPSFRKRYLGRMKFQSGGDNARQLISIEQMIQLIDFSRDILSWTLMLFLAKTGLRRGELISMDIEDLNFEKMEFRIKPKAKRTNRLGFIDTELAAALREYLRWRKARALSGALWISHAGTRISRNMVYNIVVRHAELAGLHDPHGPLIERFTPHCFRHWFTTHLRRAGMPREFIKELRGDRRKEAVDIYDHIDPEELRRSYLQCVPKLLSGLPSTGKGVMYGLQYGEGQPSE